MFIRFSLDIGQRLVALRRIVVMAAVSAAFFSVATPAHAQTQTASGSPELRALFASWAQEDRQRQGVMAIPSTSPITSYRMTSSFGTRSDPFGRGRRRHNGLDMASPRGTPIYATADGIVGRAQWVSGYGKYVEINHGGEIQTRYGHMSQILVQPGARVTRGQMIGHVGSTGRSTGNHLHYEVRIEGRPVNPMPFMTSVAYLASLPSGTAAPVEVASAVGASQ
ncbi:MAG: M23 family metallopeptidase [Sphingomonadaceae bacterium]|nr:M23 family metallopeptidase [Sphingomonadaceae bacterium]